MKSPVPDPAMADGMQSVMPQDVRDGLLLLPCNPQPLQQQAFVDSGDGGKEGVSGDKGDEAHQWSEGAVNTLLDSYGTRWNLCMRGNIKKAQWEEIASEVSSRCEGAKAPKTRGQCKSKVEKLKRKFREEKHLLEKAGKLSSKWPYYVQMDLIMGSGQRFSGINPNFLEGGTPAMADHRAFSGCSPRFKDSCLDMLKADYMQDLPLTLKGKEVVSEREDDDDEDDEDDEDDGEDDEDEEYDNEEDASCTTPKKRERDAIDNGNNVRAKGRFVPGGSSGKGCSKRRKMGGGSDLAAAVKSFGQTIYKIEQKKMENRKDADRMRAQMELKRTELLMNAQMHIAQLFHDSFKKKVKKKIVTPKNTPPSMN